MAAGLLAEWAVHLGAVAAIVTALGIIWKKVIVPLYSKFRAAEAVVRRVVLAADRLIPFAEAQLSPNGGSSLADKINRIEPNHQAAEAHWQRLEEGQKEIARKFEEKHGEITTLLEAHSSRLEAIEQKQAG